MNSLLTNLLSDTDVSLSDEHAGVVDGFGESELEDLGLESSLEEILDLETENVIKLHLVFGEDTNSDKSSKKGVTFEKSLGVFLVEGEESTGDLSDLGDGQLDAPDFSLVSETELTNEFQLLVESGLLVTSRGGDKSLALHKGSCVRHNVLSDLKIKDFKDSSQKDRGVLVQKQRHRAI